MDLDDAPKKPANMVIGENLDAISVAELEQRIQALELRDPPLEGGNRQKTGKPQRRRCLLQELG